MRVLYIARHFHPRMEGIVAALAATGVAEVTLICPANWRDELGLARQTGQTITAYRRLELPMLGAPNDYHRALYRTLNFALPTVRPQIIHAEEEPESLAALQIAAAHRLFAPRAQLILNAWQNLDRPKHWYVRLVARLAFLAADAITCGNDGAVTVLRSAGYNGLAPIIPQKGVNTDLYYPLAAVPHAESDGLRLLYAGRLLPEKDVETLLHALPLVAASTTLRIVGDGPQRARLRELIDELRLQDRVQLASPVEPTALPALFAQADALVLPSKTMPFWSEQLGRILLEAMACALPVIGSDSGAIPEVIGPAGLIFPEGNSAALADCIRLLDVDHGLRRRLGLLGMAQAERFSERSLAAQNLQLYHTLLDSTH